MPMTSAENKSNIPFFNNLYKFVSETEIAQAWELQQREGNDCPMCSGDGAKGFVTNASQWVRCFECNRTDKRPEAVIKLELTKDEEAAYIEAPHTCPFCRSEELDATDSSITASGEVHQPVKCFGCRRKWTDVYVLARIEDVEIDEED